MPGTSSEGRRLEEAMRPGPVKELVEIKPQEPRDVRSHKDLVI